MRAYAGICLQFSRVQLVWLHMRAYVMHMPSCSEHGPPLQQTELCDLSNHDVRAHWRRIVMLWGSWAASCSDFELAHKWALKQFVRVVPHGRFFTAHLAHRHLQQFCFTHGQDEPPPKQEPLRRCHCPECVAKPGHHEVHVHVRMLGLAEEDPKTGQLSRIMYGGKPDGRSVKAVVLADQDAYFRRAVRRLMADVQGCPDTADAQMPETLYRASRMKLLWHGRDGKVLYKDTFHGADWEYYGGQWFDALYAKHKVTGHIGGLWWAQGAYASICQCMAYASICHCRP